jgi:hypothetical protein
MIEGYDGDDIWMIVEDEFQSVAQSFTAHLHHAEYKKRKAEARSRPQNTYSTTTQSMSHDGRRRLYKDVLHDQQQRALVAVGAGSRTAALDDSIDEPWRGTSIAGLITSGSQEKKSLRGLDRIPSSTRAAQGFHRQDYSTQAVSNPTEPPTKRLETLSQTILEATKKERPRDQATISAHGNDVTEKDSVARINLLSNANIASPGPTGDNKLDPLTATTRETSQTKAEKRPGGTFLEKRKKAKSEEQKAQRLAAIPMFLM